MANGTRSHILQIRSYTSYAIIHQLHFTQQKPACPHLLLQTMILQNLDVQFNFKHLNLHHRIQAQVKKQANQKKGFTERRMQQWLQTKSQPPSSPPIPNPHLQKYVLNFENSIFKNVCRHHFVDQNFRNNNIIIFENIFSEMKYRQRSSWRLLRQDRPR